VNDLLAIRDLTLGFHTDAGVARVLDGVNLTIQPGQVMGLVGESGCGKTTLARAVLGVLPRHVAEIGGGEIRFKGRDLLALDPIQLGREVCGRQITFIPQDPYGSFNPVFTVGTQIMGIMKWKSPRRRRRDWADRLPLLGTYPRAQRRADRDAVMGLLDAVQLPQPEQVLRKYPHELSGGQRQRLMIAMALLPEPDLVIADEPTTALDVTIQAQILELLAALRRRLDLAILLITHDLGIVRRFGTRLAVMYAGEIVETGPVGEVLAAPLHPYTRALLACVPAVAQGGEPPGRLGFLPGVVPSLIGEPAGCQFRNRCAQAEAACAGEIPRRETGRSRAYRCVLPPDAPRIAFESPLAPTTTIALPERGVALEARDVTMRYRIGGGFLSPRRELQALRGVSLTIAAGEALGLVGESGSGKSTLARLLLGLEQPTTGTVRLFERDVASHDRRALARAVQPVFQDPYGSLNPRRSIAATIRLPLDIHGIGSATERAAAVRRMMDLCGLPARLADAYPAQLSGGQRQRVAIASAIVLSPRILICDEPTSALDVSVQAQILNLLQDLRRELGLTCLVISHDLGVIRHLADRIAVLYLGAIVEIGAAREVLGRPRHPYTQALLAAAGAEIGGAALPGEFPDPTAPPPGCSFHPRCPHAIDRCRIEGPALQGGVACHRANEQEGLA